MMRLLLLVLCAVVARTMTAQEICDNSVDDDADGLTDLNDTTDCACGEIAIPLDGVLPNPSFEVSECIPQSFSQLDCASDWDQGTVSTADYFRVEGYMPSFIPQPLPGNGSGCVGGYYCHDYMEYVGGCLLAPLLAGSSYSLTMQVAAVEVDNFLSMTTNLDLSPVDVTIYGLQTCPAWPTSVSLCPGDEGWMELGHASYTPSASWNPISINLTPTTDIQAIMLGPPCVLPEDYPNVNDLWLAYFLMDELAISTTGTPGAPITTSGNWCDGDLVATAHPDSTVIGYQWYQNGIAIPGATDTVLAISALALDSGDYTFRALGDTSCALSLFHVETEIIPTPYIALTADGLWCPLIGTYQWFLNGMPIPGATDDHYLPDENGTYTVELTNAQGCSTLSYPFQWLSTVIKPGAAGSLRLEYDRTNSTLFIHGVKEPSMIRIVDASGRVVQFEVVTGPNHSCSLAKCVPGLYVAWIEDHAFRFMR